MFGRGILPSRRVDDVLIHSSGEKTVPGPLEKIILGSPRASLSLAMGELNRVFWLNRSSILIPWESLGILFANAIAPAFSRIYKEMIIITLSDRPLPRTPKDTVIRKQALKVYEQDIDELYETIESNVTGPIRNPH
ncbi:hypothetical protein MPER_03523 [Moniliophthora perniciosa FA553]|nr:hypothetical protein MPER_03523 [Moniliophthora perniciosa FA553]